MIHCLHVYKAPNLAHTEHVYGTKKKCWFAVSNLKGLIFMRQFLYYQYI